MLNQTILVGRIAGDFENVDNNFRKVVLAVNRSYKNVEGIYETDFIPCLLGGAIATNTVEYCRKGDLIGIKGRIEVRNNEVSIIAEKVTFLSSKSKDNENTN